MLMVLAMMLPVAAPQARQVALRSLWSRRQRSMLGFLAGYLAVWALVGAVIVSVLTALGALHPAPVAVVVALVGAALWQISAPRRRVMRRCRTIRLGTARGLAADRDCAAAGWRAGLRCAFTCGPVMLSMAVGHHHVGLMGALVVLLMTERAPGPNPQRRAGRPFEGWCLIGLAGAVALIAVT